MSDERGPRGGRTVFQPSPLQQRRTAGTVGPTPAASPPPVAGAPGYVPPDDIPRPRVAPDHRNPLMARAAPLLALLAAVRSGRAGVALPDLHRRCMAELTTLQSELTGRLSVDHLRRAGYALAATADDIALNLPLPEAETAQWAQRSLQVTLFQGAIGGDLFWRLLDEMVARPSDYQDLLELYHACMAAGFEGRYRFVADGRHGHQAMMQTVYNTLERARRVSHDQLSPHWRGIDAPASKVGVWAPLLMATAVAAGLLLVVFLGYQMILHVTGDAARKDLEALMPANAMVLGERDSAPPTPAPDTISTFLQPQVVALLVTVTPGPDKDVVQTTANVRAFAPGSATIEPQGRDLFIQIAKAINGLSGPVRIEVDGYTDSTPVSLQFRDNQSLSEARAQAVQALISSQLTDQTRTVTAQGFGASNPVADNATPAGQAQNRRVAILVFKGAP